MAKKVEWVDVPYNIEIDGKKSVVGLVGKTASGRYDENTEVIIFRDAGDEAATWRALRWKMGTVLELGTDDLGHARNALDAMYQLEGH